MIFELYTEERNVLQVLTNSHLIWFILNPETALYVYYRDTEYKTKSFTSHLVQCLQWRYWVFSTNYFALHICYTGEPTNMDLACQLHCWKRSSGNLLGYTLWGALEIHTHCFTSTTSWPNSYKSQVSSTQTPIWNQQSQVSLVPLSLTEDFYIKYYFTKKLSSHHQLWLNQNEHFI